MTKAYSVMLIIALAVSAGSQGAGLAWPDEWVADSAFYRVWSRADEPVAGGVAARSWLWGPVPFAVANEVYAESATGRRLVAYTDKGRMEINDPSADRGLPWFVTSGLLVYEMITGRVQTGNGRFEGRTPAEVAVAGDAADPYAPTFATFARHTGVVARGTGKVASSRIAGDGSVSPVAGDLAADTRLFGLTYFDEVSGHNVPAVFRDWMAQTGAVMEGGRLVQGSLLDPLYVVGRPVTEAFWVDVQVGGKRATVLVQLFERRALTYNPANPPAWRVEMANVGRAYYEWRYKDSKPEPAVAAEVGRESLRVRGWNWQPGSAVSVQVDLAGLPSPLAGPQSVSPDAAGRFALSLPLNPQLADGLISKGNVQIRAHGQTGSAALPLAGVTQAGKVQLQGTVTQVSTTASGARSIGMKARDGREWTLVRDAGAALRYSEGDIAPASAIVPGVGVSIEGIAAGRVITVSEMRLLSVARTGARMGYTHGADRKSVRVSGTGWPGEKRVELTLAALNAGGPPPLKSVRADSRGNLIALVPLPSALPSGPLWLFASVAEGGRLVAQVAVPFDPPAPAPGVVATPPGLFALGASGEQAGGLGSYCWGGICASATGVPLPGEALPVKAGEVVGFRSLYGPGPNMGLSPISFSAQLFRYGSPRGQVADLDGTLSFTPKGQPVHATGEKPGRPFSVALPRSLPAGRYVLVVQVAWPDPRGGRGEGTYAFNLLVP